MVKGNCQKKWVTYMAGKGGKLKITILSSSPSCSGSSRAEGISLRIYVSKCWGGGAVCVVAFL